MNKRFLSKFIVLLFAAVFLIGAVGCGTKNNSAVNSPVPSYEPTAAPQKTLVFSAGNEFSDYGADELEKYSEVVLEFPEGNPYQLDNERMPIAAKLLLPKGWTVANGMFEGLGYYPIEEFLSYCIAARPGNEVKSVYNEKGECVGTVGLAATSEEYPGLDQAFAVISMGNGAFRYNDDEAVKVGAGKNGEAITGRAHYAQKLSDPDNRLSVSLPVFISYDSEFLVGVVMEFGENAVTEEQLTQIAESVRFASIKG